MLLRNVTYTKTQKSKLIQKLSLQSLDLQEPYTALIDMGMIWWMAIPSEEDRQTQDGTPYKWSDYVHKVSSIIFGHHGDAECIICVNDPYNAECSTKDDKRDLRVQGKAHVPNTCMKLGDSFPSATAFKTLLCNDNKGRLQKVIHSYLTDLAQSVDVEIIYSVVSHCNPCRTMALTA